MLILVTAIMLFIYPIVAGILGIVGIVSVSKARGFFSLAAASFFGIMGYYFVPSHEIDLTRYYDVIQQYQISMPTYADLFKSQGLFLSPNILFKWISKIGDVQLLPALVGLVVMFSYFYIVADFFSREKLVLSMRLYFLVIGVMLFPFASALSNVRNVMGCAIIAIAIYRDLVQKKKNIFTFILYIVGISFHIAVIVIVMLRLLSLLKKDNHVVMYAFMLIAIVFLLFLSPAKSVMLAFIEKGTAYYTNSGGMLSYTDYISQSMFMKITKLMYFLVVCIATIITHKNYRDSRTGWNLFTLLTCIVTLASFLITLPVYMRMVFFLLLILAPQFIERFNRVKKQNVFIYFVLFIGMITSSAIMIANIVTFNTYSSFYLALKSTILTWIGGVL